MLDGLSIPDLWRHAVYHHRVLRAFACEHAGGWTLAVRRTAWQGLAVLTAMIRRLIHIMAREIIPGPLRPRGAGDPLPPLPRSPGLRFPLSEPEAPSPGGPPRSNGPPDTPEFNHALLLDRLARLAAVYRARLRLARRLARRIQTGRAPLRALPLPRRLYRRVMPGFLSMLHSLDRRLAPADTS